MIAQTVAVTTSIVFQMTRAFGSARNQAFNLRCNRWLVGAVVLSIALHVGLLLSPWHDLFDFASLGQIDAHMWVLIIGLPIMGYILGESMEWMLEKVKNRL